MIEEKNLSPIGKFQKTHALKGELNALLDIDSEYFLENHPLIVNIDGAFVPFYIDTIRGKGTSAYLIKLEGIDTQEEARAFVNETIYAEKEALKDFMGEEGEELLLEDDLEGYRVVDENYGEIGTILHVDTSTANMLFVISTPSGEEVYIPVADEFIAAIDESHKEVITTLPEELINLNKKEK